MVLTAPQHQEQPKSESKKRGAVSNTLSSNSFGQRKEKRKQQPELANSKETHQKWTSRAAVLNLRWSLPSLLDEARSNSHYKNKVAAVQTFIGEGRVAC